ncbi:MAG: CHAP domain-containing protein [Fimbriimonas sp.]
MDTRIPPFAYTPAQWKGIKLPERALLIAAQECDVYQVREEPKGSNRGPRVDAYLRAARTDVGQAWCAAFVTFCLVKAGKDPHSTDPARGVRYPASVASWRAYAQTAGRWSKKPVRGRLFILPGSHIGFVTKVAEDGLSFETIEGNTNDEGSREGFEVCRRTRRTGECSGFVDLGGFEGR